MSKHPLLHGARGERHVLLGNEAIVRGALEAGVNMVTCYPGTPSSEVPDTFYKLGGEGRYKIEYAVNEKVAFEVAAGAALGGAQALVTMKHVGLNVAADPLFTAAYVGVNAGLVVCVADDPAIPAVWWCSPPMTPAATPARTSRTTATMRALPPCPVSSLCPPRKPRT